MIVGVRTSTGLPVWTNQWAIRFFLCVRLPTMPAWRNTGKSLTGFQFCVTNSNWHMGPSARNNSIYIVSVFTKILRKHWTRVNYNPFCINNYFYVLKIIKISSLRIYLKCCIRIWECINIFFFTLCAVCVFLNLEFSTRGLRIWRFCTVS